MLPGLSPSVIGRVRSLSILSSFTDGNGAASTAALALPGTSGQGDIAVLAYRIIGTGSPTLVGWTTIGTVGSGSPHPRITFLYRVLAAAGESVGYDASLGACRRVGFILRPNTRLRTISVSGYQQVETAANPAAQTVLSGAGKAPLAVFAFYSESNLVTVDPRSFTPAKDAEVSASPNAGVWMAAKVFNSAPANVVVDMDDEGTNNQLASFFVEVS